MRKLKSLLWTLIIFSFGFAAGIYTLPIISAPKGPSMLEIATATKTVTYSGEFKRDLTDSDFLHYGEGKLSITPKHIVMEGKLAPGPDYQLYLSKEFIDTESAFLENKTAMLKVANIKSFSGFITDIPKNVNMSEYNTVIIWCESFSEFITAAKYR